jgi:transposase-like protein
MPSYTVGFREEIIQKVLSSERTDSVESISEKAGLPSRTVRRWVARYLNDLPLNQHLSEVRKINAVLDTLNVSLEEKSMFCRKNGLMLEQCKRSANYIL